jgi:hypothetical protein
MGSGPTLAAWKAKPMPAVETAGVPEQGEKASIELVPPPTSASPSGVDAVTAMKRGSCWEPLSQLLTPPRYPPAGAEAQQPAHRRKEVSAVEIDGPRSLVFQQAAHRLPTERAVLETLIDGRVP